MRSRLIILFSAFLVIILGSIGVMWAVKKSPRLQQAIENSAHLNRPVNTNSVATNGNRNSAANSPANTDVADINFVARNFTERFGSDSSQSDYAGMAAAETWGTTSFNDRLNSNLAVLRAQPVSPTFHQITTQALIITITSRVTSTATVTVSTQRQETTGTDVKTYNQDLVLTFRQVADHWLVDNASWQPL
jgi:Flp pilus assembly protein TadG